MKFQAVVTPDGLISSLTRPWQGRTNDWLQWTESVVPVNIRQLNEGRRQLYLYGNAAYHLRDGILAPWNRDLAQRNPALEEFNNRLSSVRIAVKNAFGNVHNQWTYMAFDSTLTLGQQPLGAFYQVAVLMSNLLVCLRG